MTAYAVLSFAVGACAGGLWVAWMRRCAHKWAVLERIDLVASPAAEVPFAAKYVCQCEKCGALKAERL